MRRQQRHPVAYAHGLRQDLERMDEGLAPGQAAMSDYALQLITRLGEGDLLASRPLPALGNPALAGCRLAKFTTPATRAQAHGFGAIAFQIHPANQIERAPLVVHMIAAEHIVDDASQRRFDTAIARRLAPGDGQLPLIYSTGVRNDISQFMTNAEDGNGIFAAMAQTFGDPQSLYRGEELHLSEGVDLRGYRHATFDAGADRKLAAIYRLLPPAQGAQTNVVHIAAVGAPDARTPRLMTAIRLKRAHPSILERDAAQTAQAGQQNAAAMRSTTGRAPSPATATAAPAQPRRLTSAERVQRRNGL